MFLAIPFFLIEKNIFLFVKLAFSNACLKSFDFLYEKSLLDNKTGFSRLNANDKGPEEEIIDR